MYLATTRFIESDSRERFANHARNAQNTIVARVKSYTDVLRATASLFRTSDTITRAQFHEYAAGLALQDNFPAIDTINYAEHVTQQTRPAFERRLHEEQDANPGLAISAAIRPNGTEVERVRESYSVVTFIEPSSASTTAFGLDLQTNAYVEKIILATRDSGQMMNSGTPIGAISGPNRAFLGLRLPIYTPGAPLDSVDQRRAAYRGSVGIAFSVPRLVQGVLAEMPVNNVRMTLLDQDIPPPGGGPVSPTAMRILFDSAGQLHSLPDEADPARFTTTLPVNFHGRAWKVTFSTPKKEIYTEFDTFYPKLAAFAGFGGSMLMYALLHTLTSSRRRALMIAADMTQELRASQARLQASHETLRRLAAHTDQIKELERKRIAREIHDDLGQNLLALRIETDMLASRTRSSHTRLHARAHATLQQIDATIKSVRQIINDLRPNVLDLGLSAAVEWQVKEFRRVTGIECELHEQVRDDCISDQRATAFFRILQESLSNITRHAQATRVSVELTLLTDSLYMSIRDNGNGLADMARQKAGSFGLVGIEERITMLGGSLSIKGVPGIGTTVSVSAPADDARDHEGSGENDGNQAPWEINPQPVPASRITAERLENLSP
ncbi:sensor histidine kinase [Massilia cavernae]|nr:CHASE domain-containing protein [Massilia cavernae]